MKDSKPGTESMSLVLQINFELQIVSSKSFIYQQMYFISVLENIKIYTKTYTKIAPTYFGL